MIVVGIYIKRRSNYSLRITLFLKFYSICLDPPTYLSFILQLFGILRKDTLFLILMLLTSYRLSLLLLPCCLEPFFYDIWPPCQFARTLTPPILNFFKVDLQTLASLSSKRGQKQWVPWILNSVFPKFLALVFAGVSWTNNQSPLHYICIIKI